ncbi:MAG TPA: DUF4339 domain-containing protein [Propylenella sp.]|nr:DUF4339 domain-containing protein [Propylenella sp.]
MNVAAFTQQTAKRYHVFANGQQLGPVHFGHLHRMAGTGVLGRSDFVWAPGMEEWITAANIDGLFPRSSVQSSDSGSVRAAQAPAAIIRNRSYVGRHWHGELSLATSALINCILAWVVYAALAYSVLAALIGTAVPGTVLTLADLALVAFGGAVFVWGVVGAWRSANRHRADKGELLWPALAKSFVALSVLFQAGLCGGLLALLLISRVA